MTVGDRIKALRLDLGMTQEELAEKVGLKKAAINKYESGVVVNIKRDMIGKLASALETTPTYLMGWEDEPDHPRSPIDTYDDEILADLQRLHDDKDLRMLLSATRKLSRQDIQFMADLARRMHASEDHDD